VPRAEEGPWRPVRGERSLQGPDPGSKCVSTPGAPAPRSEPATMRVCRPTWQVLASGDPAGDAAQRPPSLIHACGGHRGGSSFSADGWAFLCRKRWSEADWVLPEGRPEERCRWVREGWQVRPGPKARHGQAETPGRAVRRRFFGRARKSGGKTALAGAGAGTPAVGTLCAGGSSGDAANKRAGHRLTWATLG
jgi:hypothetical protein